MPRDFRDGRQGRAVGVVSIILALAPVILFVAGAVILFLVRPAHPRDALQWGATDPEISAWYSTLMQPDNPAVTCCGEADAYYADRVEIEGDKTYAIITDERDDAPLNRPHVKPGTRVFVPNHKLKWDRGNPTGHNVIFMVPSGSSVYCFVQATGI